MAFLGLVVVTQMFAPTSLVVGIYREFYDLGLINTYTSLILTDAAFNLAFALWILQGFFSAIPKEIEEAAWIDGASHLGTMLRIMLPLTLPGIVTAVTFTFTLPPRGTVKTSVATASRKPGSTFSVPSRTPRNASRESSRP